jgi:hypothetical protein
MRRIILACALAGILGVSAKAFDGTPSPNNPPIVKPVPLDLPFGRPMVCGYAGVCLDLLAQANPGGASLREQLVGTWTLVSCPAVPWCGANPHGMQILNADGHYTILHIARGRPNNGSANRPRDTISAEEYKAIASGVQANFGTWSVDEATKTLTWHIEGSMFPNAEGQDFKGTISFSGDELKMGPMVWRRIID